MCSTRAGTRTGRIAVSLVALSLALAACRADAVSGPAAGCTNEPGCETIAESVSPQVIAALEDAGTRLTGALTKSSATALTGRLTQLERALAKRDMQAGRVALAAAYDVIGQAERTTPEALPDLGAIRLALIPAARALGVATFAASSATQ